MMKLCGMAIKIKIKRSDTMLQGTEIIISDFMSEAEKFNYKGQSFWIYKLEDINPNSLFFCSFFYNITNLDLKTDKMTIAKRKAIMIIDTKTLEINKAISTLTRLVKGINRKSIKLMPNLSKTIVDFSQKINQNSL